MPLPEICRVATLLAELLSTPTREPFFPLNGFTPGSLRRVVVPSAFKTMRTAQLDDAPTAGH
jgi:hypothetical protein